MSLYSLVYIAINVIFNDYKINSDPFKKIYKKSVTNRNEQNIKSSQRTLIQLLDKNVIKLQEHEG